MMEEERRNKDTKRIYFGGLFDCVSESEIRQRLCKYGEISNVQIVQRRDESGDILKTFAYVDINASTEAISKCFSEYNKCKWKGHEIKIQLAKESYEKRLQREWQEVKNIQAEVPVTSEMQKELYDKMEEAVLKTKHITPGSKIKDKTNWVIGKYCRPLPVVYLRSKGSKVHKFDPSKHCHQLKKIRSLEDDYRNDRIADLTWTIPGDRKIKKSKQLRKYKNENSFEVVETVAENDHVEFATQNIPGNEEIKKSKRRRKSSETETSFEVVENEADHDRRRSLTIPGSERKKRSKQTFKSNKTDNSLDASSEGDSTRVQEGLRKQRDRDAIGETEDKDEDSDCSMESSDTESIENDRKLSDSIISQIRNNKNENETIKRATGSVDSGSKKSFHGSEIDLDDLRRNKSLMDSLSDFLRSSKLPLEKSNVSDKMPISKHSNLDSDKTDKVDSSDAEVASDEDSSNSGDGDSDNNDNEDGPTIKGNNDTLISNFEVDLSASSEDSEDLDMKRDNIDIIREGTGSFKKRDLTDSETNSSSGSEDNEDLDMESNKEEDINQEREGSLKDEKSDDSEETSGSSSVDSEDQEVESTNKKHGCKEAFNICNGDKTEKDTTKSLSARTSLSSTHNKLANDVKAGKGVVSDRNFEVHSPSNASLKDSPKKKSSEEKRLGSLMEKSAKEQKEKEIVKAALKNVDPQRNDQKHIIFGSFDDAESADSDKNEPGIAGNNTITSTEKIMGKAALSWLGLSSSEEEDSTHDEGERFEVRPQFEGPAGQKLLKLQQRVGLDERFKIDERFLDDEHVQESVDTETSPAHGDATNLDDVESERSRALSILDRLLGTKSSQKTSQKTPQEHKVDEYQEPVRYDPLNTEHSKYTVAEDLSSDSADEEADGKVAHETEIKEKPQPEVSKEAFFDVTASLKNLFGNQTSSPFTFLSDPVEESSVADQLSSTDVKAPSVIKRPKPARLSSDEEDIHDDYFEDFEKNTKCEKTEAVPVSGSQRFFFTPSDPRLASDTVDGPSAFMRKLSLEELERTLEETRENIRQNFKKKHKDSLRRRRKRDANFAGLR